MPLSLNPTRVTVSQFFAILKRSFAAKAAEVAETTISNRGGLPIYVGKAREWLCITQGRRSRLSEKVVTVDCRRDTHFSRLWIMLDAYNFALTGNLNCRCSSEFRRKSHREFDIRILLNFAVDVEKHPTRAYIASFCMNCSVRTGKPQPNRHFQRKSGEYALLFQGQGPVPEIFAFFNQSERHIEKANSRIRDPRSIGTERSYLRSGIPLARPCALYCSFPTICKSVASVDFKGVSPRNQELPPPR
jgi:hypothetical protein